MNQLRLDDLLNEPIDHRFKGFPSAGRTVGDVATAGWNLHSGDLLFPVLVLRRSALEHNLALMADWCAAQGVSLAPHGKTTMAPQLYARQLDAGAWGISAATVSQARVMRAFGVSRVLLANQLVSPAGLRWVSSELDSDEQFEFLCYVDSVDLVDRMTEVLATAEARRRVPVLVELGQPGGRTGVRDDADALELADQVAVSPVLTLAGVAAYEGLAATDRAPATMAPVDALLDRLVGFVETADQRGLWDADEIVLTAGGSAYFDRVVDRTARLGPTSRPVRVVLRSGCYLTHDHTTYERTSPFRSGAAGPTLQPALELWAEVLSAPEPGLAILGFGKRDAPYDLDLPIPLLLRGDEIAGRARVFKLNDQHAFAEHAPELRPRPGDLMRFGLSHPCTAFDKWQLIPVVDDDHTVVEAVRTVF